MDDILSDTTVLDMVIDSFTADSIAVVPLDDICIVDDEMFSTISPPVPPSDTMMTSWIGCPSSNMMTSVVVPPETTVVLVLEKDSFLLLDLLSLDDLLTVSTTVDVLLTPPESPTTTISPLVVPLVIKLVDDSSPLLTMADVLDAEDDFRTLDDDVDDDCLETVVASSIAFVVESLPLPASTIEEVPALEYLDLPTTLEEEEDFITVVKACFFTVSVVFDVEATSLLLTVVTLVLLLAPDPLADSFLVTVMFISFF